MLRGRRTGTAPDWAGPPVGPGPTYEGTAARDPPGTEPPAWATATAIQGPVTAAASYRGGADAGVRTEQGRAARSPVSAGVTPAGGPPGRKARQRAGRRSRGRRQARWPDRGSRRAPEGSARRGPRRIAGPGRRPEAFAQATATT